MKNKNKKVKIDLNIPRHLGKNEPIFYERKGKPISVDLILPLLIDHDPKDNDRVRVDIDGDMINIRSLRLSTFKMKGTTCIHCGITGKYFVKQRKKNQEPFHINLYALDKDGNEVLMTKDHILPKSKGGKDILDNMQTMCTICNYEKGSNENFIVNNYHDI